MDREQYETIQSQIVLLAQLAEQLDLSGFIQEIDHADTVGPILDPTLYRKAAATGRLTRLHRLAQLLVPVQVEFRAWMADELERQGKGATD